MVYIETILENRKKIGLLIIKRLELQSDQASIKFTIVLKYVNYEKSYTIENVKLYSIILK